MHGQKNVKSIIYFPDTHFNIVLPSKLKDQNHFLLRDFSRKAFICVMCPPMHATRCTQLIIFYLTTPIISNEVMYV